MPRRRHAFSLIEIMVAVAIIALLAGLLVVGIGHLSNSSKSKSTRIALETAQGMLDRLRSNSRPTTLGDGSRVTLLPQPYGVVGTATPAANTWLWQEKGNPIGGYPPSPFGAGYAPDFWYVPHWTAAAPQQAEPLLAPGNVTVDGSNGDVKDRYLSVAVINTQIAMNIIAGVPENKSLLAQLPESRRMFLDFAGGKVNDPGADGCLHTPPTASNPSGSNDDSTTDGQYPVGVQVSVPGPGGNHLFFVNNAAGSTTASASGAVPPVQASVGPPWKEIGTATPLLADAWGNPIIFVPASGLVVATSSGTSAQVTTIIAPDHQPFFASAGPDGDFSTGDDNLYSFEK